MPPAASSRARRPSARAPPMRPRTMPTTRYESCWEMKLLADDDPGRAASTGLDWPRSVTLARAARSARARAGDSRWPASRSNCHHVPITATAQMAISIDCMKASLNAHTDRGPAEAVPPGPASSQSAAGRRDSTSARRRNACRGRAWPGAARARRRTGAPGPAASWARRRRATIQSHSTGKLTVVISVRASTSG